MWQFIAGFFVAGLLAFALATNAYSYQTGGDESNPFTIWYEDSPVNVKPGEVYHFKVIFQIPEDYYLYAEKTDVRIKSFDGIITGEAGKPEAVRKKDPFFGRVVPVYYYEANIDLPMKMPDEGWSGVRTVSGEILFQGCSDKLCYRQMRVPFSVDFMDASRTASTIREGAGKAPQSGGFFKKIKSIFAPGDFFGLKDSEIWFAFVVAFIGGLLTDFTPCVWPMIPVTLAVIGVRRHQSVRKNLLAVAVLVCGMSVMYSLLGIISASIGKGLGFLFQNIFFLVALDIFLFFMAFSLLGLFDIRLPSSWQSGIARISAAGHAGIFLIGLTMGLMAAPCVGPVVGPLLVYVAKTQNLVLGFFLLLSYSAGMGVIFLVLGGAYGVLKVRFKSGGFALWLKKGLGVLMLLTSVYYGNVLYSHIRPGVVTAGDEYWVRSVDKGLETGRKDSKPVLIDFYAEWCLPCLELDRRVWKNAEVLEVLRRDWVAVKVDCTQETNECKNAVERFEVIGWPTVVLLDANQKEVVSQRLVGRVVGAGEMLKIMEKAKNAD